jgi:hypothetical protein
MSEYSKYDEQPDAEMRAALTAENLIKTLHFLFARYCAEHEISAADQPKCDIIKFRTWIGESPLLPTATDIAGELEVPVASVEYVLALSHSPTGLASLSRIWPYVILANRKPRHKVRSLLMLFLTKWEDGELHPLIQMAHVDAQKNEINDAEAGAFILAAPNMFLSYLIEHSLDATHSTGNSRGMINPALWSKMQQACAAAFNAKDLTSEEFFWATRVLGFVSAVLSPNLPTAGYGSPNEPHQ